LITGWVQSFFYGITIRAGDPKPQPGTPRYLKHRRRIHIAVILVYLLYTIYEADYWVRQNGDFYQDLGLPIDVDEKKIKARFRRLAAIHHPDKANSLADHAEAEEYFVKLKSAQDTLTNPTKRFAYERFGPDILQWQHVSSIRDYLSVGFQGLIPLYGGSVAFMMLLSMIGYLQSGRYVYTLTRPYPPPVLSRILNPLLRTMTSHPPLLPFQLLVLAHKMTITFFIALSQLSPLFANSTPPNTSSASAGDEQRLARLENLAQANENEAARLLALEMAPFVGDEEGQKNLRGKVKEWLVQNTIRADPEVRDAMGRAIQRRRVGAPVGARYRGDS
ncbi:MAG: hypothetical protein Q9214_002792, partial [Letrouitia sp. 1 TL-2023]